MKYLRKLMAVGVLATAGLVGAGCATNTGTGALVGGAAGAGIGAAVTRSPGGALFGGAVGALTGAIVGNSVDREQAREDRYAYAEYGPSEEIVIVRRPWGDERVLVDSHYPHAAYSEIDPGPPPAPPAYESVPPAPGPGAVWVGGFWAWGHGAWHWMPGYWR
jgi:hypothetical protein